MSNPIFGNSEREQSPGIFGMINQVRNSPDPNGAMENLARSNPKLQEVMAYIQQNGGNARNAFYNLAAQKGVDPESILNRLR